MSKSLIIFVDGRFKSAVKSEIQKLHPAVINVPGAFETLRICKGEICDFRDHYKRLKRGLGVYGMKLSFSKTMLEKRMHQVISKNRIKDGRIRCTVYGSKGRQHSIVAQPATFSAMRTWKACVSNMIFKKSYDSHIKSTKYAYFYDAFKEAQKKSCDEALLFNFKGQLIEGSRSNVFVVKNRVVYTPPVSLGALSGITRSQILKTCTHLSIPRKIESISKVKLSKADEVFATNSVVGVIPIISINNSKVGQGTMGPITHELSQYMI